MKAIKKIILLGSVLWAQSLLALNSSDRASQIIKQVNQNGSMTFSSDAIHSNLQMGDNDGTELQSQSIKLIINKSENSELPSALIIQTNNGIASTIRFESCSANEILTTINCVNNQKRIVIGVGSNHLRISSDQDANGKINRQSNLNGLILRLSSNTQVQ